MSEVVALNDNGHMPSIGFGTWQLSDAEARKAVSQALKTGYRLIDTAMIYGNEAGVGQGIRDASVAREDIFVTTKLWDDDLGYDLAFTALDQSLEKLGLKYVDLYLIHWPAARQRLQAWDALVEMQNQGKIKHTGVSNFTQRHLEELREHSDVVPVVNQIEFHPYLFEQQEALLHYCDEQDIIVEAYSPLAQADLLDDPVVEEIAEQTGKTPGQVLIRWAIEHGTVPIPKSGNPGRIAENFDVFDFHLSDDAMDALNGLSNGERVTHDPEVHE
ncbi:MAG: aldo/keto reductase [Candidatus Saccharibacteria bacterium]|nr:aldo/keto reductase [Candidatus Saccharibacteria bacterium]